MIIPIMEVHQNELVLRVYQTAHTLQSVFELGRFFHSVHTIICRSDQIFGSRHPQCLHVLLW